MTRQNNYLSSHVVTHYIKALILTLDQEELQNSHFAVGVADIPNREHLLWLTVKKLQENNIPSDHIHFFDKEVTYRDIFKNQSFVDTQTHGICITGSTLGDIYFYDKGADPEQTFLIQLVQTLHELDFEKDINDLYTHTFINTKDNFLLKKINTSLSEYVYHKNNE